VRALAALGQSSRLGIFRLLVRAGPDGLPAGAIAREIGIPPSTLSTHLGALSGAGLIGVRREGRSLLYSIDFGQVRALLDFLIADCCDGRPEICVGLLAVPCTS
jgi:ArsR family transcriptional regulator, arsenate/arsenite/antimonite-responsive transcriptional repressor